MGDSVMVVVFIILWLLPFVVMYQIHRNTLRTAEQIEKLVALITPKQPPN